MDLMALKAKTDTMPGQDANQIRSTLNAMTIVEKVSIKAHDINKYLMLRELLIPIRESTVKSCKTAALSLELFESFDQKDALVLNKLDSILTDLVNEVTLIDFTATDKAVILSLGDTMTSWAKQNGFNEVTLAQLNSIGVM